MRTRLLILLLALASAAPAQRFFPDDPLLHEPPPRPVGALASRNLSDLFDLFWNTLARPGERQPLRGDKIAAQHVNTLGDPMDGAWWERRHYWTPLTGAQLRLGPDGTQPPSMDGPWQITAAKSEGVTPGFVMRDAGGRLFFVKFDSPEFPELATGADQISGKLFHALGYHVPDNYIVEFPASQLQLAADARISDGMGVKRKMGPADLAAILRRAARTPAGLYRATASRGLPGTPLGPYRYHGTRSDDVNDVVPHEHRRDLRGMKLAAAWVDHDDSRAVNTIDMLVEENGLRFVRHYQLDFGSTLGSASYKPNSPRSGGEYLFDWKNALLQFVTLGTFVPEWARARYPDLPSVGRFECERFRPENWVPEYPNPAFVNALPDDDFWIARQIMALSGAAIREIVASARYSDPRASDYIAACLISRRDRIGRYAFARVLPLDGFAVNGGRLTWRDLSAEHGFGGAGEVALEWFSFDNGNATRTPASGLAAAGEFPLAVLTSKRSPSQTISVYLRRSQNRYSVIGLERQW